MTTSSLSEREYRQLVDQAYQRLETAFEAIDPDVAEFEFAQGAVTILFANRSKLILSTQPSVRQIWLAAAAKGVAYHFDYNPHTGQWVDDKGLGRELLATVKTLVVEAAGVSLDL